MFRNIIKRVAIKLPNIRTNYSTNGFQIEYVPRRALLYVPGSNEKMLLKSLNLNVDTIILNCEDGVAISEKESARNNVKHILDNRPENIKCDLAVRVNDPKSKFFEKDVEAFVMAKNLPDTILIPKINSIQDMSDTSSVLKKYHKKNHKLQLIFYIECAKSLMNLKEICMKAFEEGQKANFLPVGIIFGGDDYLADIGARKTSNQMEMLYARQKIVNIAKAFELQAIDIVHNNFKDLQDLECQCLEGAQMGFTGKQVIHPLQIETVQRSFSPTTEQINWAKGLIKEHQQQEQQGKGAFTFAGDMIDAPLVKQAMNILKLSNQYS